MIQSAVPLRVGAAIDSTTGEVVNAGPLIDWLLDLVADLSADLMGRCWQPATFTTLHEGVDARGRQLPPTAAVVAQRLGWIPRPPAGVYVSSRVVRLAQANVVPILKPLAYRDRLIPHVMAALGEDGHLDASRLGEECQDVSAAAARSGLEVVMCPPRGTSALCPSCDRELVRPRGYHSASCPDCGINGADRDLIAGQNIAKRVLLAKNRVKRPKNKPKRITTVVHQPISKTRHKTTATPQQRRHKRTRRSTPHAATANRSYPARQASVWDRDQPTASAESTSARPVSDTSDAPRQHLSETDRRYRYGP